MALGAFSISLAIKDIGSSRTFYEKLGFSVFGGDQEQNWLIMKNGSTRIGLFQGMFEKNAMTFNPGWDSDTNTLTAFTDVRRIRKMLAASGVDMVDANLETPEGPGHIAVEEPDGNRILIDQHV